MSYVPAWQWHFSARKLLDFQRVQDDTDTKAQHPQIGFILREKDLQKILQDSHVRLEEICGCWRTNEVSATHHVLVTSVRKGLE